MGIALGCIGITYDDFVRLDYDEFGAIYKAWADQRNTAYKDEWERMRLLATITIQPHLSKGHNVTPERLLPLPWDKERKQKPKSNTPQLTPEQQRRRMEELTAQMGDTLI